jgi:hypothetical protein
VVLFIAPLRERQTGGCFVIGRMVMVVVSTFSLLSTTVLAEPTVAEVEEMCGLVHSCRRISYDRLLACRGSIEDQHDRLRACRTFAVRVSVARQVNP